MNKRERVKAFMEGRPVDRAPIGMWMRFPKDQSMGKACVDAHLAYYEACDLDIVKIMSDGYMDYPNPVVKQISSPTEWYTMRPLGVQHPFWAEQLARVRGIREGLREDLPVFYSVFAPFTYLRFGAGTPLMMEHLFQNPEATAHAMSVVQEDLQAFCEVLFSDGICDGLYFCLHSGEQDRMTEEMYRTWIAPPELEVLRLANSLSDQTILHCCGWAGSRNRMSLWQEYPAKAVNWAVHIEGLSLSEGKAFFGGRPVIGGFDNRKEGVLTCGSKEAIQQETQRILAECAHEGLMLGADCTLPVDFDWERVRWVLEAIGG